jgi:hypothetical protein
MHEGIAIERKQLHCRATRSSCSVERLCGGLFVVFRIDPSAGRWSAVARQLVETSNHS